MGLFIGNAFSLNMLSAFDLNKVQLDPLTLAEAKEYAKKADSVVGHADTASVFSSVLGTTVEHNRCTLSLIEGDTLIVGQYKGPRLEEGTTLLPEGATIEWIKVSLPWPFSWAQVELDERDFEDRDISYIWDQYGPIDIGWLAGELSSSLRPDLAQSCFKEMVESVPSIQYGDTVYLRTGEEWLETSNHCTTGAGTISTSSLVEMYL